MKKHAERTGRAAGAIERWEAWLIRWLLIRQLSYNQNVRLAAALDSFLHWRRMERGATPRSTESYRAILEKLVDRYPGTSLADFDGKAGTELLRQFLERWADRSASTRCNVISVVHSFFAWAVVEELIDADPSGRIRRPPKRKPRITRPSPDQLAKLRAAANLYECRRSCSSKGQDCGIPSFGRVDGSTSTSSGAGLMCFGRVNTGSGCRLPRMCWRSSAGAPSSSLQSRMITCSRSRSNGGISNVERVRYRLNPKRPASSQALGRMVKRVCRRATIAPTSPHGLRHGFQTGFFERAAATWCPCRHSSATRDPRRPRRTRMNSMWRNWQQPSRAQWPSVSKPKPRRRVHRASKQTAAAASSAQRTLPRALLGLGSPSLIAGD